jgi:hypothetical protein
VLSLIWSHTLKRSSAPPPLRLSIRDSIGQFWFWIHCPKCGGASKVDPSDLADTYGADYPLDRYLARCTCARCGARGATITIQPPYRPDQSDRPRPARHTADP